MDFVTDGKNGRREAILQDNRRLIDLILRWNQAIFLRNSAEVAITDALHFIGSLDQFRVSGVEIILAFDKVDVRALFFVLCDSIRIISHKNLLTSYCITYYVIQ